ncbi:MAG TPA: aminotransferase class III-fold pyridoxal phosphate-dependent enzyme [Terriglobales bacterium]|nr:aminotransferase class III-fold pyridoxal phosphate-dependent enzyme [Terriglobales bacterium]
MRTLPNTVIEQATIQGSPGSALLRRSFRKTFPPAVRGQGAYLWDSRRKQYLDLAGSAAVNFIGHGVAEIVSAMADQARSVEFVHSSQFTTPIAEQYATELLEFAGPGYKGGAVYFTTSGSDAVEFALKLAREYQVEIGNFGRSQFISRDQSQHGSTLGAIAVSRNGRRSEIYRSMVREFSTIGTPYCYRCSYGCKDGCANCAASYALELEAALAATNNKAAAMLLEPVSGTSLGAVLPPPGYLAKIAETCEKNEVLLIADEVTSGMGRTGRNFAVHHWDVTPDILVTSKGLSSGYAPLAAVIVSPKVVEIIAYGSGAHMHGFTYSSHPISLAAGRAVLSYVKRNNLVNAADSNQPGSIASKLRASLDTLCDLPSVGDVRGMGLLWAIEFVADKDSKTPYHASQNFSGLVAQAATDRGLLVYPGQGCAGADCGDHILLAPPAVISPEQVDWACAQLADAIQEANHRARQ